MPEISQISDIASRSFSLLGDSDGDLQTCEHQLVVIERIPELRWKGEKLLKVREARGAKRRHLALALDVHPDQIRKWEENKNTPSGDTIARLTLYFGADAIDFFEKLTNGEMAIDPE